MTLTGRPFAEDALFTLVVFDRILLHNMYIQNAIRSKRFPHLYDGYDSIGVEQLGDALIAYCRRRQECMPGCKKIDDTAIRLLWSAELASRAVWGNNAGRSQCRHKAFFIPSAVWATGSVCNINTICGSLFRNCPIHWNRSC